MSLTSLYVVSCEDHQSVVPQALRLERRNQLGNHTIKVAHHRVVRPAARVVDEAVARVPSVGYLVRLVRDVTGVVPATYIGLQAPIGIQ